MECSEVRDLLSPMSDREIAADQLRVVEEHLRTCRECAFQSSMIVGLKKLLGRWDGVHASENFRVAVLERVRREPPPRKRAWMPWALGGALAAVCVVVLVLAAALPVAPDDLSAPAGGRSPAPSDARPALVSAAPPPAAVRDPGGVEPSAAAPPAGLAADAGGDPVAQLRTIERAVSIERPGSAPALAAVGDVVSPGMAVRLSEKGCARLALVAGLVMRLEGGAYAAFSEGDFDCDLRAGRALFCANDRAKRPRPYRVRSGAVTVELRDVGGALIAAVERTADGALRAVVAEGEAAVRGAEGERKLGPGRAITVGPDGRLREAPGEAGAEELEKLRRWGRP